MVLRLLLPLLSLVIGMASADCPYAMLNLFYYSGSVSVNADNGGCSDEEVERIGAFFDLEFDFQVSELSSVGAVELTTVVCAEGGGRRLESDANDRRFLQNWVYNTGGGCKQCPPDDDDDDRRSLVSFSDAEGELETALSAGLTSALLFTYLPEYPESCLAGQSAVSVSVTLTETTESVAEDPGMCGHETYCCAPKGNVQSNCLEEKSDPNHSTRWCHQEEWRCIECNGYWVDAANPPTCTSFWDTCDLGNDDCCEGSECQGNHYYSQCNPTSW